MPVKCSLQWDCQKAWANIKSMWKLAMQTHVELKKQCFVYSSSCWFWSLACCLGYYIPNSKQISAQPQNIFDDKKSNMISTKHNQIGSNFSKALRTDWESWGGKQVPKKTPSFLMCNFTYLCFVFPAWFFLILHFQQFNYGSTLLLSPASYAFESVCLCLKK